ncbi:hypothetical protein [Nocardia sp. NPDC051750]|uniref:hypothetical protein n=1 Tax=Nocardia sp. NPDC051750 TaxID=3364325 RepID=UPI003798D266
MTTFTESTLERHCRRYREKDLLPAVVDPLSRRIMLHIGAAYGAVTMPTELGESVLQRLRVAGIAGPVFAHPRALRWTFLTGPTRHDEFPATAAAELFRRYTTVAGTGSQIVLPSAEDELSGYRLWVAGPDALGTRPPQQAVIDAVCEAGRRGR